MTKQNKVVRAVKPWVKRWAILDDEGGIMKVYFTIASARRAVFREHWSDIVEVEIRPMKRRKK